jgi:hypothetical protein
MEKFFSSGQSVGKEGIHRIDPGFKFYDSAGMGHLFDSALYASPRKESFCHLREFLMA